MLKPDSLRAFLTAAVPALAAEADRLKIFVDKGTIRATGAATAGGVTGFEYGYTCTLLLLDLAEHPDAVFVPLLVWVGRNQPDLLQNFQRNRTGISFDADILADDKIDLQISLELTERVIATPRAGGEGVDIEHAPEPPQAGVETWPGLEASPPPAASIYAHGELIAEIPAG